MSILSFLVNSVVKCACFRPFHITNHQSTKLVSAKTIAPTALHRHGAEIHHHRVAIKNTPSPKPISTSQSDSVRALRARAKCLIQ